MADPQSYRPKTADIPTNPGVYRFLDGAGRIIYVGKAKNLRNRLTSYFRDPAQLHPRTRQMVFTAEQVIWVIVKSELEALTLEYAWIKEYSPLFNVMYRDDKSYPYLAITSAEEFPRLTITRTAHRKGNKYYGPYTQVRAVRESLDLLLRVFPVRTCTTGVFNAAARSGRPCLNGYIEKCVAPCIGKIDQENYREIVNGLIKYLDSDGTALIAEKKTQMQAAAAELEFEKAAKIRDQIMALETVTEKNTVVLDASIDADIYGISADELEASVQVFYVRGGRIRGQRGWITDVSGQSIKELLSELLLQVYGVLAPKSALMNLSSENQQPLPQKSRAKSVDDITHTAVNAIPREIWLPEIPEDHHELTQWLGQLRRGSVQIRTPQRGAKAKLLETVEMNARQALARHKLARTSDLTQRSQALEELRSGLDLPRAPLRIECYDISHIQGEHQVGSMVVFEDGLAQKKEYRRFIIRGTDGTGASDDTAAMREVLHRRLTKLENKTDTSTATETKNISREEKPTSTPRFAYRPDLIVVDGGLPQVNAAQAVITELGSDICVIGLAKRLEEIWIPGEAYPLILSRNSPALHLLQYLRDESHRFAIEFHRKRRGKAQQKSVLDNIPGLGAAKQKALLQKFKSVKQIKAASVAQLQGAKGIGPALAATIYNYFAQEKHLE